MEDEEGDALAGEEDQPLPAHPLEVESNVCGGDGEEEQGHQHFVHNKPGGGNPLQRVNMIKNINGLLCLIYLACPIDFGKKDPDFPL